VTYTERYATALAEAGYFVIHPNFRNYPPSDSGDNEFRAGYAIDVLNLIALIRGHGGAPGPLAAADPGDISLWGHSMGGGVALRVLVVDEAIRAAALYGSMSGDEYLNYERIFEWTDGRLGQTILDIPPDDMERIAPIHHLDQITAAVSVHHGAADNQVPAAWSDDLCRRLRQAGKTVECFTYPGAPHYFGGTTDALFQQRVLDFFERY
jgi:dipeptidyl aminopeptidase/acylaminoacyl peptidase